MLRLIGFSVLMLGSIPLARAEAEPDCGALLAAVHELKAQTGTAVEIYADAGDLDATVLGPEGLEILRRLDATMIGHADVKLALARAVQRAASGVTNPRRPIGVFLMMGVTGTGKSLTAESLAEAINDDPGALVTISGGELQEDHEIAKVTGSPAGYTGHDKTKPLVTREGLAAVTSAKYKVNVVLVDEIEKASGALFRLLLGVMERARMTTGTNEEIDFSKTILILTCNLGQRDMQKILNADDEAMGFRAPRIASAAAVARTDRALEDAARAAAKTFLDPEFRNRIDKTFVFKPHDAGESRQILDLTLATAQRRLFGKTIAFELSSEAANFILTSEYEPEFGGRSLRRTVDVLVVEPLVNLIAAKTLGRGDVVTVRHAPATGGLTFRRIASGLSASELASVQTKVYGADLTPASAARARSVTKEDPIYAPARFGEYCERIGMIDDPKSKLDMIQAFVVNAPEVTDAQFLTLLKLVPDFWDWGVKDNPRLVTRIKELNGTNWSNMQFEPSRLHIYWYGMSRIKFLSNAHRAEMNRALGDIIGETDKYLRQQNLKEGFVRDILALLRTIHGRVMSLPEPEQSI